VGTSLGYLHLHATSGRLIHRQRLHATACCSVQVRNRGQGLDERDASEDVTVGFADAVARISVFEVHFDPRPCVPSPSFPHPRSFFHFLIGGGPNRENCTPARNKRHAGDAPSNQPTVAGVFPQRNVGTLKPISLSPTTLCAITVIFSPRFSSTSALSLFHVGR